MLTQTQEEEYVKHPSKCPFCKSNSIIEHKNLEANRLTAWQTMSCEDCKKEWENIYTLSRIEV